MSNIEKVSEFLDKTRTYYLATVDGDQPRVRPVSKQLAANPKAEICAFDGQTGTWLRVSGELINDDSRDVKVAMLEKYPDLKGMYNPDDDNTQVLFFKDATATFSSFTAAPEEFTFIPSQFRKTHLGRCQISI